MSDSSNGSDSNGYSGMNSVRNSGKNSGAIAVNGKILTTVITTTGKALRAIISILRGLTPTVAIAKAVTTTSDKNNSNNYIKT